MSLCFGKGTGQLIFVWVLVIVGLRRDNMERLRNGTARAASWWFLHPHQAPLRGDTHVIGIDSATESKKIRHIVTYLCDKQRIRPRKAQQQRTGLG